MPPKRIRTTEGSCWSCKQRRVKCDLQKPSCRKCLDAGEKCNYNKIVLKWNTRPTKGAPAANQLCLYHQSLPGSLGYSLATNEKRAIEYFRLRVWPLFHMSSTPCQPPIALALGDRSVLLATCVMADSHRVLHDGRHSRDVVQSKRLHCLATLRKQLAEVANGEMLLSTLLVAVLLLYFSDGYVECSQEFASTSSHHAGVRAIIDSLGGLPSIMRGSDTSVKMLLSEFATTDVTNALLQGRVPCFPSDVWDMMDPEAVWWDKAAFGMESFDTIFKKMADLARYRDLVQKDPSEFSMEKVQAFESGFRPGYATMESTTLAEVAVKSDPQLLDEDIVPSRALCRAFQHSANLYLYRAICALPPQHPLVQQHAQACLDCITGMPADSKALNCALYPIFTSAAHTFSASNQKTVIQKLETVYENIKFDSVNTIKQALKDIWGSQRQLGSWDDMFSGFQEQTLVL